MLLLTYAIVILPRLERTTPAVLTIESFVHLEAVERIVARPPSLYVRLDAQIWRSASAAEKQELLEQIGRIADQNGYLGVRARIDGRAHVGQWLKRTGVRVIERSGGPS